MGATTRDLSGVFAVPACPRGVPHAVSHDPGLQIGPRGMTFVSSHFLPEWTEVDVELRLPGEPAQKPPIDCHGVIVQCQPRLEGSGYDVSLLFLDLPARARSLLAATHPSRTPPVISIAR